MKLTFIEDPELAAVMKKYPDWDGIKTLGVVRVFETPVSTAATPLVAKQNEQTKQKQSKSYE